MNLVIRHGIKTCSMGLSRIWCLTFSGWPQKGDSDFFRLQSWDWVLYRYQSRGPSSKGVSDWLRKRHTILANKALDWSLPQMSNGGSSNWHHGHVPYKLWVRCSSGSWVISAFAPLIASWSVCWEGLQIEAQPKSEPYINWTSPTQLYNCRYGIFPPASNPYKLWGTGCGSAAQVLFWADPKPAVSWSI